MLLPENVRTCISALEDAGYAAYVVGGCVRDSLLGLTPHDYDLCTAATPAQTRQVFANRRLVLTGEKHGTVAVVTENGLVEITTFRTEGGYQDNRHPDWVTFVPDVTQDLARRDFTINAMAYSPSRGFADPFGGRADLQSRTLRAVGDPAARFQEDALRILRGARFAVCYGLTPEPETAQAMNNLAPLIDSLARERVFGELCKLLPVADVGGLLRFSRIIAQAIPELAPTLHFDQRNPHHAYDLFTHIAHVTAAVPPTLSLRWAALLHDIGKPSVFTLDENGCGHFQGHAKAGASIADTVLDRLKAPTVLREQVVFLVQQHMTPLEPDKKLLRRRLGKYGPQAISDLLALQRADFASKGSGKAAGGAVFDQVAAMLREIEAENACLTIKDLAVNGRDLLEIGFLPGPSLGRCLESLLDQVQEEMLPNHRQALLDAAASFLLEKNTI